jgi:tetratricopeptide (TPR) repeat protein
MKDESVPQAAGRVFISYRREETAYPAGWLFDRLSDRFGHGQIFKDVDSIQLGDDFVEVINSAVGSCDVLLALIGDQWLTVTDEQGRARLDNPDDYVRLEIEAALTRDVRVIPILVGRAGMPRADQLPASMAKLVRRNALELSPSRFEFDTGRLLKVLERTLADVRGQPAVAEPAIPVATRQAQVRALYVEARAEMRLGQFQTAIDLLTDLLALDPHHRDATQLRDAAVHQLFLADTYQQAADSEAASDWAEAVNAYSDILEADPTYRDAAARREACQARQQVSDLQGELRHHAAAAHWQAVLDVNAELAGLDPSAADPDGLATQAQQVLDEEQARHDAEQAARRQAEDRAQRDAQEAARRQAEERAQYIAWEAARRQAENQAYYDQPQYAQPVPPPSADTAPTTPAPPGMSQPDRTPPPPPPPPVRPPSYPAGAGAPRSQPRRKVLVAAVALLAVVAAISVGLVVVHLTHRTPACPTQPLGAGATQPYTADPVTVVGPAGWVNENSGQVDVQQFNAPSTADPDAFSARMLIGVIDRHPKKTMKAQAQARASLAEHDPDVTEARVTRLCRFLGADAADLEYTGTSDGVPLHGIERIWNRAGTTRSVLYLTVASAWPDPARKLFYQLAGGTRDH